jgi:glycosyltransferase involved in cell wall biosynthesis
MRIGYLHLGDETDGVCRYGRLLADEARRRAGIEVREARTVLRGDVREDRARLEDALRQLTGVDVIHLQYNQRVWGGAQSELAHLNLALHQPPGPVVVTLHDVYPDDPWAPFKKGAVRRLKTRLRRWLRHVRTRAPHRQALGALLHGAAIVLVCSEHERAGLRSLARSGKVRVVRHFVEERRALPGRVAAKQALGLADRRVVTLLGFVHRRKGYDVLVEAVAKLPDDVFVVFAGAPSPGEEGFAAALLRRAAELGVAARCRMTGFLGEHEQVLHLAATDLAVCPFYFFSASGSLSTWISTRRPVLCHDLPQIAEYREIAPGAFHTFTPHTPEALASVIESILRTDAAEEDPAMARLYEVLRLPRIFDDHLTVYRDAARGVL